MREILPHVSDLEIHYIFGVIQSVFFNKFALIINHTITGIMKLVENIRLI